MELEFTRKAREDLLYLEFYNPKLLEKARAILNDIENHPTRGIGKPEQLRHDLTGRWSRRIDRKNRIIYRICDDNSTVFILSLRGHYEK